MKEKPTFIQKAKYRFDNFMSRGLSMLIMGLFGLSLLLIIVVVGVISVAKAAPNGERFGRLFWMALMRVLDAGTMSEDQGSFLFVSAMFFVTLVGIFLVSTLIGILSNCIDQKMDELRRGKSQVIEEGHILILGWAEEIFTIIRELIIANENQTRSCVVILSEMEKTEMESALQARIGECKTTRIICRSGNPIDAHDQEIVQPQKARTIILLPPIKSDPDTWVIKGVLSITNNPDRKEGPYHIVGPIKEKKNLDALEVISDRDKIQPVYFEDLIARITAQTSRQCGLSVIYTELLNFENDEIYFVSEPRLNKRTYLDALLGYEDSAILGIKRENGGVILNPSAETLIAEGDSLIGISRDDDTFYYNERPWSGRISRTDVTRINRHAVQPEKSLVIGWSNYGKSVIRELDEYAGNGSTLTIAADPGIVPKAHTSVELCYPKLKNVQVDCIDGDTTSRSFLDSLHPEQYDSVLVLAYRQNISAELADSKTLLTLLHLRDIANKTDKKFSIVTEILDERNRPLVEVARVDDFIVSDYLISLMITQMTEAPQLESVFKDLFNSEGVEIYLKPITDYVDLSERPNFYELIAIAIEKSETAIGYRLAREEHCQQAMHGIHLNPAKSQKIQFEQSDALIVLSEN